MNTLTFKTYQGQEDWSAIATLLEACQSADSVIKDECLTELQLSLSSPNVNPKDDICLWENNEGQLLAIALIEPQTCDHQIDGYLRWYIHPSVFHQNLEQDILRWSEKRIREMGRQNNRSVQLKTYTLDHQTQRNLLLKNYGFTVDRHFLTMEKSLQTLVEVPSLPSGYQLSYIRDQKDIPAWVELFNESFIDHWDHHELTVEQVQSWHSQPNYQPELDLVAVAPDGTFAAFCSCQLKSPQIGWIEWLGTRRGFRKLGLGRAILLAGLYQLQKSGATLVRLSVDAQSLTGATKLYQSIDFQAVDTWYSWAKPLPHRIISPLFPHLATA